jgi:hypothetical protein
VSDSANQCEGVVPAGAGQNLALLNKSIESEAFTTPLQLCAVVRHSHDGGPSSLHCITRSKEQRMKNKG